MKLDAVLLGTMAEELGRASDVEVIAMEDSLTSTGFYTIGPVHIAVHGDGKIDRAFVETSLCRIDLRVPLGLVAFKGGTVTLTQEDGAPLFTVTMEPHAERR